MRYPACRPHISGLPASRKGVAALIALVALAVLFVVLAAVAWQSIASRRVLARREEQLQAQWLARAGLEMATARLLSDATGYKGESVTIVPRSLVRIDVQSKGPSTDVFQVTCAARYPTDNPHAIVRILTRKLRRTADKDRVRLEVDPGDAAQPVKQDGQNKPR